MTVRETIRKRFSVRAYLNKPVHRDLVYEILDTARFAPSGHNTQPWEVLVLMGKTKETLSKKLIEAYESKAERKYDFTYGNKEAPSFIKDRRKACNVAVFDHKGIDPKKDKEALDEHIKENFRFFRAPVELIFIREKNLGEESFIDLGIFAQTIMLLAVEYGLGTCAQTSITAYADVIRKTLNIPENKIIVFAMAMGYPDAEANINKLRLSRIPVEEFTTFYE